MLVELEDELLRLLNETEGSLLENVALFQTLQTSKATSLSVQKSLEISETTEVQIDLAREVHKKTCLTLNSLYVMLFIVDSFGKSHSK